jgi:zinc-ribbon domain
MPEKGRVLQEAKQQTGASKRGQRTKQQTGASKAERAKRQGRPPVRGQAESPAPGTIVDDIRLLRRKVQAALVETLLPGEQPHVVIKGALGCAIVGTGERALVLKAGARFGSPLGPRVKAFEYESVIGVRFDTERPQAVVAIDAPVKIASCRIYWADSRDNAWKARNAIPVDRPYRDVEAGVEELKGLLEAFRERHPSLGSHGVPIPTPQKVQALPASEEGEGEGEDEGAVISALPVIGERCPHCHAELRPGWRFCPGCGAPSESASARPS